jgi:hypothetical protein
MDWCARKSDIKDCPRIIRDTPIYLLKLLNHTIPHHHTSGLQYFQYFDTHVYAKRLSLQYDYSTNDK